MKKRINTFCKKTIATLLLLTYILALIPALPISADEGNDYTLPTVSLTWKSGTTLIGGAAKAMNSTTTLTATLTLTGDVIEPVTVVLKSFDISASASAGDYTALEKTIELDRSKKTAEITVSVGKQTDAAVELDGTVYTKQFGITIASVTNASPDAANNTLRAHVGYSSTMPIVANTSVTGHGNNEGYVHKGAGTVYSEQMQLYTKTAMGNVDDSGIEITASKDIFGYFDESHLTNLLKNNGLEALLNYYSSENLIAYSGYYQCVPHSASSTLSKGARLKIGDYSAGVYLKAPLPANGYYFNFFDENADDHQYQDATLSNSTEKLTLETRNDWTSALDENNIFLKDYSNVGFNIASTTQGTAIVIRNVHYAATLTSDTAPKVTDYRLVNSVSYENGMLLVAVDFSKPVQLVSGGKELLKAKVNIGGQELTLDYVSGEFTKTLVFGTVLNDSLVSDKVEVLGVFGSAGYSKDGMVADLLWNEDNENNLWTVPSSVSESFDVSIDTRLPSVSFDSCATQGTTAKGHEVFVSIKNISSSGTVYYAWSENSDAGTVTQWNKKTDFVVGSNSFALDSVSGDYYLHIKAVSPTGVTAYWSSDAYSFNNIPPTIQTISCDTAGNSLPSHTLTVTMDEEGFENLTYVYMYIVDEKNTTVVDGTTVYEKGKSGSLLKFDERSGTIKVTHKTVGMAAGTAGNYKIGFLTEDTYGNRSNIVYSDNILFDNRDEMEVDVLEDPDTEIEEVNGYEVLISGENKTYEFQLKPDAPYSEGDRMGITNIIKNGKTIFTLDPSYSGTDPYKDGFGKNIGAELGIESITYNPSKQSVTFKVNENAKGYYEISFFYNDKSANDISVYFTTENDSPKNFYSISEEGLLSNRVWAFSNKRYYRFIVSKNEATTELSYQITSTRYAEESGAAPIFSDKEKAYEYALFMELQDVALIHLGSDSASIVELLNGGMSGHFKKAVGETATAAIGQTWIRYKNSVWDASEAPNAQDYAYYFYSNTAESELDYDRLMSLLIGDVLKQHAKSISAYDSGEWLYLTANTGLVDGNGEPSYRKDAVFDEPQSFTGLFSEEITYSGDPKIYSTTISDIDGYREIDRAYLLANYTFTSESGRTVLFYREYGAGNNETEYTQVSVQPGSPIKFRSIITKSGVYEFIEFDENGSRKFYVYADYYAPTLRYEYTQGDTKNTGYIDRYVNGSTIRASTITIKEFLTEGGTYTPEYDEHAYLYITNTSGKITTFMTAVELKESGGYTLNNGTWIVYLYDRLGNFVSITVRANESELYTQATVKDEEALLLTVNRAADEIAIGGFTLYKNNVALEMDFAPTMTLYESGQYRIVLTDIYGNTFEDTFTFQRPYPVVEFQCQDDNGDYVAMGNNVNGSAYVVNLSSNAYQVTASTEIRLKYASDAEYEFTIVSGNPTLKYTRSGSQYVRIVDNNTAWTIKVSHKKDPSTYIVVTCAHDTTPPKVDVSASTQEYSWNEQAGVENVLFAEKSSKDIDVLNGQTINCRYAIIDWFDETEIRSVTLTKDGEILPLTAADMTAHSVKVSGFGDYVITVTDILNNTSVYKFTIANELGLTYYINDEITAYHEDPLSQIVNGVYTDTQYTNQEVKLVLSEYGKVSFLYKNGTGSGIYQICYSTDGIKLYSLQNREYLYLQTVSAAYGELFASDSYDFTIHYEIKNGSLALIFPKPDNGWEFWQIRVTDTENTSPNVIQFERTNENPSILFVETETGEFLDTDNRNEEVYTGAKSTVTVYTPSITETIVKISAYYSEKQTFDFYRMEENVLYGEGTNMTSLTEEGYYKIVVADVYGNFQIVYIRIGFGFETAVKIIYDSEDTVEYFVDKSGSFDAKSNHSVQFTVWAEKDTATVKATKNGTDFTPKTTSSKRYFTFTVEGVGEYEILIDDGCGNVLTFTVSIKAPVEIVYNDYLTGFNEDALYRDRLYTNGKVNIDFDKITDDGINYIFYRVTQDGETSSKRVIYNLFAPDHPEYKKEDFLSCIGKEGNGTYDIVFADAYGNFIRKTVRISDGGSLTVSRLIENTAVSELLEIEQVVRDGAWSNRSIILSDTAEASLLTIDGKPVSFTNGEYRLDFPSAFAEGYETHKVEYLDEYGNRYVFTIHLLKQVVEVKLLDGIELLTIDNEHYVKGPFGYTWTDSLVTAVYTINNVTLEYKNGEKLTKDGKYLITFTDRAGNSTTKTVCIDTTVSYKLIIGHNRVPNGIATNERVTIYGDNEQLKVISVKRDGKLLEMTELAFSEHGVYEVELCDPLGNTAIVHFELYTHAVKELDYTAAEGFAIMGVWFIDGASKVSYANESLTSENGVQICKLNTDGDYEIEIKDLASNITYIFKVSIDRIPPSATLVGADDGAITRNDVTIMGIMAGDHVDVYRGNELIFSKTATKDVDDPPTIKTPGDYRIVVSDEAGNTLEYTFTKEFKSNTASNIIILMLLFLIGASGFVFLIVNGKAKVK